MVHVTVWNEFRHEKTNEKVAAIYPDGMHVAIANGLSQQAGVQTGITVGMATLDEPDHGLTDDILAKTDVMMWWGHIAHGDVRDEIVEKVYRRVLDGMGLIVLHSGHYSKIFRKLMGTDCHLQWREADEKERIWVVNPAHPIAAGLGNYFEIPQHEMYGEHFDIPEPDSLVFISWFEGGNVFRSGCCYHRGRGKVFYFSPGHETYPIYYQPEVMQVMTNAVHWAAPTPTIAFNREVIHAKQPLETIKGFNG